MNKFICIGGMYEECDKESVYIRHTQFAGSHPLCKKHAIEDKNFMIDDSYTCWEVLNKSNLVDN